MTPRAPISRRRFGIQTLSATAASLLSPRTWGEEPAFSLNYILGSPMYGTAPLRDVLGEARKIGAKAIDVWPRVHANHREQMDQLGLDHVERLLEEQRVQLGAITRYDLGPYRLMDEIPVLKRFGGQLLVTGARRQGGDTVKQQVALFVESMKPHVAKAEENGITIGIENHSGTVLSTPDAVRHFGDLAQSPRLGLALAPYHLPQDPQLIAGLIRHLGAKNLVFFQAWQHGMGCAKKLPKQQEMLQMPGRGPLDFRPLLAALREIRYQGWTEIFMHPVPRGIAIRETTNEVTAEINRARHYLSECLVP